MGTLWIVASQRRSSPNRERILVAAADAFARAGYDSVIVTDVVGSLGLTKGALYHSFASKEVLAREILERYSATWSALADRVLAEYGNELEAVVAMTYQVAGALHRDPILRAGIRLSSDASLFDGQPPPYLGRIERFTGMLRAGQKHGTVRPEVDPGAVAWLLIVLFTGAQALPASIVDPAELTRRLDAFWALVRPQLAA
ncbi:MAG TPA: ScbR family autoregulator-binding transcription factor [Actinomycetota bacterium]|nr:ScbR family autoregulator-binding transcription factor [Actinomycetota bacterium]